MITGWLVKLVVTIALVGFLAVEVATPVIVRFQMDGLAHDAADEAARVLLDRNDPEAAQAEAVATGTKSGATVEKFEVVEENRARVTLRKEARSYLLKKWSRLESWYDVRVTATSEGRR